jgi:hypothetical protein
MAHTHAQITACKQPTASGMELSPVILKGKVMLLTCRRRNTRIRSWMSQCNVRALSSPCLAFTASQSATKGKAQMKLQYRIVEIGTGPSAHKRFGITGLLLQSALCKFTHWSGKPCTFFKREREADAARAQLLALGFGLGLNPFLTWLKNGDPFWTHAR